MKCPRCWAEKAYLRTVPGWKGILLACLLWRPMKCHHCYHKFSVPWILTLGKQIHPPMLRIAPMTHGASGRPYDDEFPVETPRRIVRIEHVMADDQSRRDAA